MSNLKFDIIVIGGGHAGAEAAHAAAKLGSQTALITLDLNKISLMPCNPSIGGVGKGHIVYEISALGGLMPKLCTQTYLQARMLNTRKGPAVQGLRLQIDKNAYSKLSGDTLTQTKNLELISGKVEELLLSNDGTVSGVKLANGTTINCKAVIITTGTFLNGLVHVGHTRHTAGRSGEEAAVSLSQSLRDIKLELARLKTGTPPRILRESVDFTQLEKQEAHDLDYLYEFEPVEVEYKLPCYIAHTNKNTHQTILDNAQESPIFTGGIQGKPPRYCPSIEDKVRRFAHKDSHHVFIEPEDATYEEVYPSGLSTAMPLEVQEKFIRSMKGFENAVITKPGYAVEYDYVEPTQLKHTLEVKKVPGLFLAGQINGTTGYEEAAGQGIIAGINASQKCSGKEDFVLKREESYIGLMIDDLVTIGVTEPYRMFTSRAERRIVLRQDNVFMRLSPKAYALGMLNKEAYGKIERENNLVNTILSTLRQRSSAGHMLNLLGKEEFNQELVRNYLDKVMDELELDKAQLSSRATLMVYAEIKYEEYIKREQKEIEKAQKYRDLIIPASVDFTDLPGLSKEVQEKLAFHKPQNIGEAMLISGMTPAAISLLIFRCR